MPLFCGVDGVDDAGEVVGEEEGVRTGAEDAAGPAFDAELSVGGCGFGGCGFEEAGDEVLGVVVWADQADYAIAGADTAATASPIATDVCV